VPASINWNFCIAEVPLLHQTASFALSGLYPRRLIRIQECTCASTVKQ